MCVAQFGGGLKTFGFVTGMNFLLLWILIPPSVIMGREAASQKIANTGIPKKINIAKLSLSIPNGKDDFGAGSPSQKRGQDLPKLPAAQPRQNCTRHQIPGDLPQMLDGTAEPLVNLAGQQPTRGFSTLFSLFFHGPSHPECGTTGKNVFLSIS